MKQVVQSPKSGKLELLEVPAPALGPGLVLVRNHVGVAAIQRVGFTSAALTPAGLWPSDHAGVTAQLQMPDAPN